MEKKQILKHLDSMIEKQVPDVWDEIKNKIHETEELEHGKNVVKLRDSNVPHKKRSHYKGFLLAAVCLMVVLSLTFTPVLAAVRVVYDKIFSSNHIDDTGVRTAMSLGNGQTVSQIFYDEKHDITVHFEIVMTDDKETKLLFTFQSKETNLKNYYVDIFEGASSINLIAENGQRKRLGNVGWGSRYYDSKENKVAEALSFESIKEYEGENIRLEIENLTIYDDNGMDKVQTIWPVNIKLNQSAISEREIVKMNKEFTFKKETYTIKQVEFSELETRVVVATPPSEISSPEKGMDGVYFVNVMSNLEQQFLHARKIDKKYGYIVDNKKSGVFLRTAGEKADPIFSKGEVEGGKDEYIMIFAPVKDRQDCVLEIGDDLKIPLS